MRDTPPTITVPPQPVTTEFTRRLAQAQAMVLVTQCQRVEKALIDGPGAAVSVRVVRATGLLAADKGGTSDPFVTVLSKGSKKAKTSVKKKTLEPEWDETLELSVLDAAAPLSFAVWDHDKIGTNDALGAGEVLLGQCAPGAPTPLRVALSTQGAIEVVVTFSPAEPADEPDELSAGAAAAAAAAAGAGAEPASSGTACRCSASTADASRSVRTSASAAPHGTGGGGAGGGVGRALRARRFTESATTIASDLGRSR